MWTPGQLLKPDVIQTLEESGQFSPLKIEFLGWLSYNAAALNRSRNPIKAAHTILAKEGGEGENGKRKLSAAELFEKFVQKKKDSLQPVEIAKHDEIDEAFSKFERWLKKNTPQEESNDDLSEYRAPTE